MIVFTRTISIGLTLVCAYGSLLGLYLSVYPASSEHPTWHLVGLFILACAFAWIIVTEIKQALRESHRVYRPGKQINRYMCRWVSRPGRTAIVSRDLSWGNSEGARSALLAKAKSSDLILYMHHKTELSEELRKAGAEIRYYDGVEFEPKSRFTVIGYGKDGSRVAVGTMRDDKHVVYEFDTGTHPIAALSDDLITLLKSVSL